MPASTKEVNVTYVESPTKTIQKELSSDVNVSVCEG